MATFFHSGSQPVPVGCYSIFVREEAVSSRFPMAPDEFERRFQVLRRHGGLFMLVAFTGQQLVDLSRRLAMTGFFIGSDFAVTGPIHGPIHACPGIVFWDCGVPSGRCWRVNVERHRIRSSLDGPAPPLNPAFIDRLGRLSVGGEAGVVLAHRARRKGRRQYSEYLCAFPSSWGFELNIHRYRSLGDIPPDWLDSEDELLPEHRDREDRIILPDTWGGQQVYGEEHGAFVGPLEATPPKAGVQISSISEGLILAALSSLRWNEGALPVILSGLTMLMDAAPIERQPRGPTIPKADCQPIDCAHRDQTSSPDRAPDPDWQRRVSSQGGLIRWAYMGDEDEEA